MKALSIRQPWADMIVEGKKTLELRNWAVNYRGPLAIHASQTINESACRANGIDPRHVSAGVVIGIVDLVDIVPLDESDYESRKSEHLTTDLFKSPHFGWKLSNPVVFEKPFPFTGRMGLFNVPDDLFSFEEKKLEQSEVANNEIDFNSRLPFELQVRVEPGNKPSLASYRLALFQKTIIPHSSQTGFAQIAPRQCRLVSELGGTALKSVADAVLEAIRHNGYSATDLGLKRHEPFQLTEESGVRLALIFLAIRPITKVTRIEEISRGIRAMTGEELYYWFAKCTGGSTSDKAQKALRILLSEE